MIATRIFMFCFFYIWTSKTFLYTEAKKQREAFNEYPSEKNHFLGKKKFYLSLFISSRYACATTFRKTTFCSMTFRIITFGIMTLNIIQVLLSVPITYILCWWSIGRMSFGQVSWPQLSTYFVKVNAVPLKLIGADWYRTLLFKTEPYFCDKESMK